MQIPEKARNSEYFEYWGLTEMEICVTLQWTNYLHNFQERERDNIPEIAFCDWNPTRYTVTKFYALRGTFWIRTNQIGTVFSPYWYNKIGSLRFS